MVSLVSAVKASVCWELQTERWGKRPEFGFVFLKTASTRGTWYTSQQNHQLFLLK